MVSKSEKERKEKKKGPLLSAPVMPLGPFDLVACTTFAFPFSLSIFLSFFLSFGGESNGQPTLSRPLSCDDAHHRADGKTTGKDNQLRDELRIGTWNVRTLLQVASLELLTREMDRCTVQLLGISEMRWTGKGHFTTSDGHTVYFSGNEKGG